MITRDDYNGIGKGVVGSSGTERPDMAIFDSPTFGKEADILRQEGIRVFGASSWDQALQNDPEYKKAVIRATWGTLEPLAQGVQLYVSAWFNGVDYISSYVSLVYHRMHPGGNSVDVGFTGCISNFWQPTDLVTSKILTPLCKVLRRANHRGCVHIRSTVDRDTFSISDIAASFEHPLSLLLFENTKHSIPEILLKVFSEDSTPIQPLNQWASSIMLSVPPFPYTVHSTPTMLTGLIPANLKHIWLVDAMRESGQWYTSGSHGKVGYVTSRGTTTSEATRRAYRTINNLQVKDLQYRGDVGRGVNHLFSTLRTSGWIK